MEMNGKSEKSPAKLAFILNENRQMKEKIHKLKREIAHNRDYKLQTEIIELSTRVDILTSDIKQYTKVLDEKREELHQFKDELYEERKEAGGPSYSLRTSNVIQKNITRLEGKLEHHEQNFNTMVSNNRKLREKILILQKKREHDKRVCREFEKKISKNREKIGDYLERTNLAHEEKKRFDIQIEKLGRKRRKVMAKGDVELSKIDDMLQKEIAVKRRYLIKKHKLEKKDRAKREAVRIERTFQFKRLAGGDLGELYTKKKPVQSLTPRIDIFEGTVGDTVYAARIARAKKIKESLTKLKEVTGSSIDEIVHKIMEYQNLNEGVLERCCNELSRLDSVRSEIHALFAEKQNIRKYSKISDPRYDLLVEKQHDHVKRTKLLKESEEVVSGLKEKIGRLIGGLRKIFLSLSNGKGDLFEPYFSQKFFNVDSFNVTNSITYMGVIERKIIDILSEKLIEGDKFSLGPKKERVSLSTNILAPSVEDYEVESDQFLNKEELDDYVKDLV